VSLTESVDKVIIWYKLGSTRSNMKNCHPQDELLKFNDLLIEQEKLKYYSNGLFAGYWSAREPSYPPARILHPSQQRLQTERLQVTLSCHSHVTCSLTCFLTWRHTLRSVSRELITSLTHNIYRNLFYYDTHNQHLYLRSNLTTDVGSFTTVLVHCLAHVAVGEMGNDAGPHFVESLYSLMSRSVHY